jgi:hypothetical protein
VNGLTHTFAAGDVQVGSWNEQTRVFTNNGTPRNAVRLSTVAVVPLMLGNVIQKPSVTVRATAVAKVAGRGGMTSLNGFEFKNNGFVGSYDSSLTTTPTEASAGGNVSLATNGNIEFQNNGTINGDLLLGPGGSVDGGWTITGTTTNQNTAIVPPAEPAWAPAANPGSITNGDYTHTGGTLLGGTYWFTSLTVNAPLTFSGPATVYINGNVTMDANNSPITAYNSRPANLTIYQIGPDRTFTAKNNTTITAVVIAPRTAFEAQNKIDFYGQFVFSSVLLKNTANFFFDESAAPRSASLVK